jgi:hypothetical protein
MFPRNIFKACFSEIFIREGGLVRPPSKSCRFFHPPLRVPEYGTECFVACGRRQGLLALDLGSIFEKLLHQKTFNFLLPMKISQNRDSKGHICPLARVKGTVPLIFP